VLNRHFINDIADFLAGIMLKYASFFIVGDFNIHVCFESRPMAKVFLNLIDSLNLTQSVSGPTPEKGHTLDLVLSYGSRVCITESSDTPLSDHLPVLFTVSVPCSMIKKCAPGWRLSHINPLTATQFSVD